MIRLNIILALLICSYINAESSNVTKTCPLPKECEYSEIVHIYRLWQREFISDGNLQGIRCQMQTRATTWSNLNQSCNTENYFIEFNWQSPKVILDAGFDIFNLLLSISKLFRSKGRIETDFEILRQVKLKGVELDLIGNRNRQVLIWTRSFELFYTMLRFHINGKVVKSCQDIIDTNLTDIRSIFQINVDDRTVWYNCEYPDEICPLVFKDFETALIQIHRHG